MDEFVNCEFCSQECPLESSCGHCFQWPGVREERPVIPWSWSCRSPWRLMGNVSYNGVVLSPQWTSWFLVGNLIVSGNTQRHHQGVSTRSVAWWMLRKGEISREESWRPFCWNVMFPPFFSHFWAAVVGVCSIGISTMMAKATCSSTWLYPLRPLRSCIVAMIFFLHSQLNQLSCGYIHVSSKVVCVQKETKLYKCHWCITSIYLGNPYKQNRIS